MRNVLTLGFAAAAALILTAGTASAQCGYHGGFYGGSPGISIGYHNYSPRSSFSIGFNSYPSYSYSSYRRSYQPRGHYDYHPTTLVRHRNHFHVQPGHYDYHRGRRHH